MLNNKTNIFSFIEIDSFLNKKINIRKYIIFYNNNINFLLNLNLIKNEMIILFMNIINDYIKSQVKYTINNLIIPQYDIMYMGYMIIIYSFTNKIIDYKDQNYMNTIKNMKETGLNNVAELCVNSINNKNIDIICKIYKYWSIFIKKLFMNFIKYDEHRRGIFKHHIYNSCLSSICKEKAIIKINTIMS